MYICVIVQSEDRGTPYILCSYSYIESCEPNLKVLPFDSVGIIALQHKEKGFTVYEYYCEQKECFIKSIVYMNNKIQTKRYKENLNKLFEHNNKKQNLWYHCFEGGVVLFVHMSKVKVKKRKRNVFTWIVSTD